MERGDNGEGRQKAEGGREVSDLLTFPISVLL